MARPKKKITGDDVITLAIGAVTGLREKIEEALDKWVEEAEEKAKEAREKISNLPETGKEVVEESRIKNELQNLLKRMGIITADDLEEIGKRIERIEAKIARKKRKKM